MQAIMNQAVMHSGEEIHAVGLSSMTSLLPVSRPKRGAINAMSEALIPQLIPMVLPLSALGRCMQNIE